MVPPQAPGFYQTEQVSDYENYFWCARQNVQQAFNVLLDILSPSQTFFSVDDWQISVVFLFYLVTTLSDIMLVEPCWTKCPARYELSAEHQQKSAKHHTSASIFRNHWGPRWAYHVGAATWPRNGVGRAGGLLTSVPQYRLIRKRFLFVYSLLFDDKG